MTTTYPYNQNGTVQDGAIVPNGGQPNIPANGPTPPTIPNSSGQTTVYNTSTGASSTINNQYLQGFLNSGWSTTPASQPTTPTPVVGPSAAINQANNAQTTLNNYDQQQQNLVFPNPPTSPGNPAPLNSPAPKPILTPEQTLADMPTDGNQWVYNTVTGERKEVPTGTIPAGYSSQNPTSRTDVQDSVSDQYGTTIKKFTDGTYGRFDINGNYSQGTQAMFDGAKRVNDANTALDNLTKGILTPEQQSQIESIKKNYADLIDKQNVLNANATGGQINLGFMSGIAGTGMAQGMVTNSIQQGINAIQKLQADRDSAIAKMRMSFQANDIDLLNSAFSQYNTSQAQIQDNIDKLALNVQNEKDKLYNQSVTKANNYNSKYTDLSGENIIEPTDTQEVINKKLQTSDKWQNEQLKSDALTKSAVNKANSTSMNLTDAEIATAAQQIELSGNPSSVLAGYGRGDSPNRLAIMKRVMDDIGEGKAQPLGFSSVEMKFASNIGTQNVLKYLGSLTGQNGRPGNLDELIRVSNSIDRTQFPPINSAQFKALELSGDPAVVAYAGVVTEVADQVAKIMQGGTGSATSDAKLKQASDLFKKNFTKEQIEGVAKELKVLLENRKETLIGDNPFLQEYSSHPTVQNKIQNTTTTNTGNGTSNSSMVGKIVSSGGKNYLVGSDGETLIPQ